jgi:hypothetical protein
VFRHRPAAFLALVALVVATTVTAAHAATSGSGVISGSGTSYTLTVTSSGDTIKCMRYFAPSGVTVTSASGPGSTGVFSGGFGSQGLSIASGQTATFSFMTSAPLSASNNGSLHLSSDCVNDVTGSLSGPTATTPPSSTPCNCVSLNGRVIPKSIKLTNPGEEGGLHMEFDVAWFMNCTTGSGGCSGQLEILPPQPAPALKARMKPLSGRINCVTECGTSKSGVMHFTLIAGPKLGHSGRKGKAITLTMKRTCQGKNVAPQKFVFLFNRVSLVDKAKSKFK